MSDIPTRIRSRQNLHDAMLGIGELDARRRKLAEQQKKAVEKAKAKNATEIAELDEQIQETAAKCGAYVDANREAVLGDKKSVVTEAGAIALRKLATGIEVTDDAAAIAYLDTEEMDEYLTRKTTLDKRALVKDTPAVPGVSYTANREQLTFTPTTSGEKVAVEL